MEIVEPALMPYFVDYGDLVVDGEILHVQRDVLFRRLQVNVLNWDNFKDLCRSSLVCDKDPTPKSGVDLTATHSFGGPRSRILFGHSG
ncbi:hypothetical protein MUK42_32721 [Musa troglodytarum]|uniref:Uncharacterized protein n=1 Tax=Musa troglodytarum TaxID=320322 RepID=A0A9E7FYI6_9LILI|nr:hypothetical protein MUK42_32721 [Musa troglodytarum]